MNTFITICLCILALCICALIVLLARVRSIACRALLGDAIFYLMIAIFIGVNFFMDSSIVFEIPLLGALLGILSTVAMARILSQGRR